MSNDKQSKVLETPQKKCEVIIFSFFSICVLHCLFQFLLNKCVFLFCVYKKLLQHSKECVNSLFECCNRPVQFRFSRLVAFNVKHQIPNAKSCQTNDITITSNWTFKCSTVWIFVSPTTIKFP
jgi:hypothetical protein